MVRKTPPKKPQYPVNIFLVDFEFKCGSFSLFARLLSKKEHEAAMGDKKVSTHSWSWGYTVRLVT